MSGIQSGSSHLIIPKRIFAVVTLGALGGLSGVLVSNHLYNRQVEQFLHEKTSAAKRANTQLTGEKDDYRALFNKLTVQMDEDDKKAAAPSKFNIISGSQHVIVSKSGLFQVVLLLLAALGGTLIAEKLRLQRNKARQRDLHDAVKDTNKRLVVEKEDYKNIFGCVSVSCGGFTSLRRVVSTRGGAG